MGKFRTKMLCKMMSAVLSIFAQTKNSSANWSEAEFDNPLQKDLGITNFSLFNETQARMRMQTGGRGK